MLVAATRYELLYDVARNVVKARNLRPGGFRCLGVARLCAMLRAQFFTLVAVLLCALPGCISGEAGSDTELIWGRQGTAAGELQKPRAIAIDGDDNVYLVDMTARIQVFTPEGEFLRGWRTPEHANGRPTGLSFDREGNLLVADTHYFRMLVYSPAGELLSDRCIGGRQGHAPGEFGFVTDAVQDSQGNYYVADYGEFDRIQKFSRDGRHLLEWGGHGQQPGQFARPQSLVIDENDHVWVADSCNHRIQVFDSSGKLLKLWGEQGREPGQLSYPYGLALDLEGHLLVLEYGNHRVQKFSRDGRPLAVWGSSGRGPGQTFNPWSIAVDSQGRVYVLDSNNHRVQRISL